MRTSAPKHFGYFEINGVSPWKREDEVEPVRTFYGQRKGIIFSRFYADVFYGWSLNRNVLALIPSDKFVIFWIRLTSSK